MNRYNQLAGCHSPLETFGMMNALKEAGFNPEDHSWHNDETDCISVVVNGNEYYVWVGDPENEGDYTLNHLMRLEVAWVEDFFFPNIHTVQEIIAQLKSIKLQSI